MAGAPFVREEEAGRELERVGGVRARDGLQLADGDLVVGGAVLARFEAPVHDDVLRRASAAVSGAVGGEEAGGAGGATFTAPGAAG